MSKGQYFISCPVCGKLLFRSQSQSGCVIDVQCPKCGSRLTVQHVDCTLSVRLQVQRERKIKLNIEDGEESANWEEPLERTSQSKSLSKV